MTEVDRSRQAALEAVLAASKETGARAPSQRLLTQIVEIAYQHQFSPGDRLASRRAIREIVQKELEKQGSVQ